MVQSRCRKRTDIIRVFFIIVSIGLTVSACADRPESRRDDTAKKKTASQTVDTRYTSVSPEFIAMAGAPVEGRSFTSDISKQLTLTIPHPENVLINIYLKPAVDDVKKDPNFSSYYRSAQWTSLKREKKKTTVTIDFPYTGYYWLYLTAEKNGGKRKGGEEVTSPVYLYVLQAGGTSHATIDSRMITDTGEPTAGRSFDNHVSGNFTLTFHPPAGVDFRAMLYKLDDWEKDASKAQGLQDFRRIDPLDDTTRIRFAFPAPGDYLLFLGTDRSEVDAIVLHVNDSFAFESPGRNPKKFSDLSKYRTSAPHPRALQVPDELSARVFKQPHGNMKKLVDALVHGIDDPFEKARILHDWTALNISYDWKNYLANTIPPQLVENVVKNRKGVCEGYAEVYRSLCLLAGIECEKISGYARGYELLSGKPQDTTKSNHAWNALKLADAWYLVDVTWDSPSQGDSPNGTRPLSTAYFLQRPEFMIYQHFPTDAVWQLITPAVTSADFVALPNLESAFLDITGAPIAGVGFRNRVKRDFHFSVPHEKNVTVSAYLKRISADKKTQSDHLSGNLVEMKKIKTGTEITVHAPDKGDFGVDVHVRASDGRSSMTTLSFQVE
jgi:transglutaminase-like putative cysteine protease